jgi:hypothetical protein
MHLAQPWADDTPTVVHNPATAPTVERAIDHGVGDQQPDEDATACDAASHAWLEVATLSRDHDDHARQSELHSKSPRLAMPWLALLLAPLNHRFRLRLRLRGLLCVWLIAFRISHFAFRSPFATTGLSHFAFRISRFAKPDISHFAFRETGHFAFRISRNRTLHTSSVGHYGTHSCVHSALSDTARSGEMSWI